MTKQEEIQNAIEWIAGFREGWNDKDNIKYCNMAIKALERADLDEYSSRLWKNAYERGKADAEQRWIPVSERLPEYGVSVLTYDGICYCVEKRIQAIRGDNGEPIFGEWWVSDDYDESNSEYYPNLRDGACIAWKPLPEPYTAESEG